jgi:hypothetical protein
VGRFEIPQLPGIYLHRNVTRISENPQLCQNVSNCVLNRRLPEYLAGTQTTSLGIVAGVCGLCECYKVILARRTTV